MPIGHIKSSITKVFSEYLRRRSSMKKFVGYCKECGAAIHDTDEIPGYTDVYECSKCGHPHADYELWDEVPSYINNIKR